MPRNRNLALIDGPVLSEMLLQTCAKNHIPVYFNRFRDRASTNLPDVRQVGKKEAKGLAKNAKKIYTAAESMLPIAALNDNEERKHHVSVFKDKALMRRTLSILPEYRNFLFREMSSEELKDYVPEAEKVVLKPSVGFFAAGVRVATKANFPKVAEEAMKEVASQADVFPSTILQGNRWLVEEFINGDEYAADAFFDRRGRPRVNAIYHHPFRDENDTRQLLYYSNAEIMSQQSEKVTSLLKRLAAAAPGKLRNFPVHAEYRVRDGVIHPMEINAWRFGGFGLSDLPGLWGVNQYAAYFDVPGAGKAKMKKDMTYALILCRNPESIYPYPNDYKVDHESFKNALQGKDIKIRSYKKLNHVVLPVSSVVLCETRDKDALHGMLSYDTSPHYIRK